MHYAMKTYGRRSLDVDNSWSWVVSFMLLPLYPRGNSPTGTHCTGGWVWPRAGLDGTEKWKFLTLPGLEVRTLCRPARSQSLYRLFSLGWTFLVSYLKCPIQQHRAYAFTLAYCTFINRHRCKVRYRILARKRFVSTVQHCKNWTNVY
jgi:hypothetical protein